MSVPLEEFGRVHELKTWPEYFTAIENGDKTFELREDDRGFQADDYLRLKEWHPQTKEYTGRVLEFEITYVLSGPMFGVRAGWVCMAIRPINK